MIEEPVAWLREWDGDDSDLGQLIAVSTRDEIDEHGSWHAVYTLDQLGAKYEVIRRSAERGLKLAQASAPKLVDIFQHILDELER